MYRFSVKFLRPFVALSVLTLVSSVANAQQDAPAQQTLISNARETTFLTGPLDKEGYVDYVKAINQKYADGVTAENNFEVVVRGVLPPDEIGESMRSDYFGALGIPIPEEDSLPYVDFISFALRGETDDDARSAIYEEHDVLMSQPWLAKDHPQAAEWLKVHNAALDKLVEGSKRARFYQPYLAGEMTADEPYPRVLAVLLPSIQQQREIARALSIRATNAIARGDLDAAWQDVQAMHRVSAHIGRGFTLIESLVAIAIKSISFQVETRILASPELTDQQAGRFLEDLKVRKSLPPIADRIDYGERLMGLDVVVTLARNSHKHGLIRMFKMIQDLSAIDSAQHAATLVAYRSDELQDAVDPEKLIDWNVTLRLMNKWYDRLAAAAREPDFAKRRMEFAAIDRDIKKLAGGMRASAQLLQLFSKKDGPAMMGDTIGRVLVSLLIPAVGMARKAEDAAMVKQDLLRAGFAVECYRRDKGAFPKTLADLVPNYLTEVPDDACAGKPLTYVNTEKSPMIYSAGRNGNDDRGRTIDDNQKVEGPYPGWDDEVVRLRVLPR